MQLNQAVLYEGTVDEELKMLVSLIASQAAGCRYCQAHMANLSSIYKASDKKIAAVWEFEDNDLFSDAERAALRLAVNASIIPNQAIQQDFDELAKYFDEGQVVELVASNRAVRLSQSLERHHGDRPGRTSGKGSAKNHCCRWLAGR
jgi:alkylhydroperoxidase family enzyme